MDTVKSNTENVPKQTDTGRRSFMWKVGAGMSAVLAATVPAIAKPAFGSDKKLKTSVDSLSKQVAFLENEKAIRDLHRAYEGSLDKGMYKDVISMFTDDAEVIFNGGLFKGKKGVKRLFCEHFSSGQTGRRIDPAPGFELSQDQQRETLEVAHGGRTARASFTYSIQVGAPIESDSVLVKMARLQGEGLRKWWEGGVYEVSYIKDIEDGCWRIKRLEYRTLSRADYRPGKSYAEPVCVPRFSKVYPKDSAGPDRLV